MILSGVVNQTLLTPRPLLFQTSLCRTILPRRGCANSRPIYLVGPHDIGRRAPIHRFPRHHSVTVLARQWLVNASGWIILIGRVSVGFLPHVYYNNTNYDK